MVLTRQTSRKQASRKTHDRKTRDRKTRDRKCKKTPARQSRQPFRSRKKATSEAMKARLNAVNKVERLYLEAVSDKLSTVEWKLAKMSINEPLRNYLRATVAENPDENAILRANSELFEAFLKSARLFKVIGMNECIDRLGNVLAEVSCYEDLASTHHLCLVGECSKCDKRRARA